MDFLIDRNSFAAIAGCDVKTVDRFRHEGCPTSGDRPPRYDLRIIIPWLRARDQATSKIDSLTDARRRRELANATMAELDAAERTREMIAVKDVVGEVESQLQIVMSRLRAIPSRVAQQASDKPAEEVQRLIGIEIEEALESIQEWGRANPPDMSTGEAS